MEILSLYHLRMFQAWLIILCVLLSRTTSEREPYHPGLRDHIAHAATTASDIPSSALPVTTPVPLLKPSVECISTVDKTFKFALTTHRNSTGHWIADMDVQHGEGSVGTEDSPFEVQLEHRTVACATCEDPAPVYARVSVHEPPPIQAPVAGGYRFFPGFGYYKRHQRLLNWKGAREVCQEEGADLVVINSDAEAKLLLELSAPLLFLKPADQWNAEAYIGVYDFHHEGNFITVTGLPLNESGYVNWSNDEPNNFREEDCVTIVRNAKFNDVQCSKLFEFICEVPLP